MPEDMGKEMLMLGGTLIGFIAALLTVLEKPRRNASLPYHMNARHRNRWRTLISFPPSRCAALRIS
jgi:hypothetical protein